LRDCSVYTQRAYAIALAHFFSWLRASGGDPDRVTRQIVGSYIDAFAQGAKQGAVGARGAQKPRQPRTINHRLSVLASHFDYCIRRDTEDGRGPWKGRINPASGNPLTEELRHGMIGRDLPARQRQRDGFRRRIPRTLPKILEPASIQKLIDSAGSYRDKAILLLLSRAGQRIGDWSPVAGRHGILGMELEDIDRSRRFITVRLKGARDQHRVPVTDDFWPIYEEYLRTERRAAPDVHAVWIASRKGRGKPLRYATFESALRYIGRKAGISVHPHLFRNARARRTGSHWQHQGRAGDSRTLTSQARQPICTCASISMQWSPRWLPRSPGLAEPRSTNRGHQLKLNSTSSIMPIKRSRNWSAPLPKFPRSSHQEETLDECVDVCSRVMPRKSR
jgi:site-specific recombinase XerD